MLSPEDRLRARFQPGDTVGYSYRRQQHTGTIVRLNPKRAVVQTGEQLLAVPYERLHQSSADGEARVQRLDRIQAEAESLLLRHGLKKWRFRFDHAARRAGCCSYRDKTISLAFGLAAAGEDADIRDTLLHETAHALVGRKHHHDAVWRAKALEIGGSGERTHKLQFAEPRWTVSCENRCWTHTAQRRNRRLVCRHCGGRLVYAPYRATA